MSQEQLSKVKAKSLAKLLQKKDRYERQEFLAEGVRLCQELLNSAVTVSSLVFTPKLLQNEAGEGIIAQCRERNIPTWETTEETLQRLSDTSHPQPVVACGQIREHKLNAQLLQARRLLVLLDMTDPGNVGTLIRTAQAFNWDAVVGVGSTSDLYNPKVMRASMGAAFYLPVAYAGWQDFLSFFQDTSVSYVVSDPRQGIVPPLPSLPPQLALILGNEAHGIPPDVASKAHMLLRLPMAERVDSLNVGVAGGILLFLLRP